MDRLIRTGLNSVLGMEILKSVLCQMAKFGVLPSDQCFSRFATVEMPPEEGVCIRIKDVVGEYEDGPGSVKDKRFIVNGFMSLSDDEVLHFFADRIKLIMFKEFKQRGIDPESSWGRENECVATFFPHCKKVCIADIYSAYEHLMGWEKKEDKVSDEKNRVQGTKNEVVEAPPEEEPMDTLTPLLEHLKMAVSLIDYNVKSLEKENISGIIAAMQILKMANTSLQADFQSLLDIFGYNRGFRK